MANELFNKLEFYGDRRVKSQIKKWKKALASYKATKDDPYRLKAIREVFYPDSADEPDYGSGWVHPVSAEMEILPCEPDEIALQSAWGIPKELVKYIASKLSAIDKNAVVKVTAESGSQLSIAFAATNSDGETYLFSNDIDIDSNEDYPAALEKAYRDFDSLQYVTLRKLVDSVQNVAQTLQEHFKPALVVKRFRNDENDGFNNPRVGVVWSVCPCGSGREYLLCCGSDELSNPDIPSFQDERIDQIMREKSLSVTEAFNVLMETMGYAENLNTSKTATAQQAPINDGGLFLAPNPLGLEKCEIKILEINGKGPNSDGIISIKIKYAVTNKSDADWEYQVARVQVLDADGLPIEEQCDTFDELISAGDTGKFEAYLSSIEFKSLGENPDNARVLVNMVAYKILKQKSGEFDIPAEPFEMLSLPPIKLGDTLQMVVGSLWKTCPDNDNASLINVKALIQNLTSLHLHRVLVTAEIADNAGRNIADVIGFDDALPGDVFLVSAFRDVDDKQLKGAKISFVLRTFLPMATGLCEHAGLRRTGGRRPR